MIKLYIFLVFPMLSTLDQMENGNMKRNYKGGDSQSPMKNSAYWQPFGLHLWYHHQLDNHKNRLHSPISLERIWDTKFWIYCNFAWYLYMKEVNTSRATSHFQNGFNIMPILDFWRQLEIQLMENNIETDPGDIGGVFGPV